MDRAQHRAPNYFGLNSVIRTYHFICSVLILGRLEVWGKGRNAPSVMHLRVLVF